MNNNFLISASGRRIDVLDPKPEDIDLHDIALGLARQRRFAGHTKQPYNVAQHSCMAAELTSPDSLSVQMAALFHDGSEAYLGDIIHPIKVHLPDYVKIEAKWMTVIAQRFGLDPELLHKGAVKWADYMCFRAEVYYLCNNAEDYGFEEVGNFRKLQRKFNAENPVLRGAKTPWTESFSVTQFLRAARKLSIK